MSNGLDIEQVREYYERLDNNELMRIALHDAAGLTLEAQEIVKQEIEKRKLGSAAIEAIRVQNKQHSPEEIDSYCTLARRLNCPDCGSDATPLNGALTSSTISMLVVTIQNKN